MERIQESRLTILEKWHSPYERRGELTFGSMESPGDDLFQFFPFSKVQTHTSLGRTVGPFTGGNKVLSDVHEGKRCLDGD
jgi:hypothetical protein